eukprot:TRINITY_DN76703_c0_g1_i1.p1 TRINITY_DN76703_c0_g1~~TRINITY_DN76703_c0_g1_i1.p1  ORF type:complete len:291 (+),score=95.50 TRINITY_DN76703_c0_g1_i1:101-973(+)
MAMLLTMRVGFVFFFLRSCLAVRIGNDDSDVANEIADTEKDPDRKKIAKKLVSGLVKYFGNEEKFDPEREALSAIRETEMQGGAGGQERKYGYLGTKCLWQRSEYAAKIFKEHGCKRVLEVGGYSSPLPKVVAKESLPETLEMYIDIDPSANKTMEEDFTEALPTATLQLLLDEFRIGESSKHIGRIFDCFLMLGTTRQNIGSDDKKKALADAVALAKVAILEYPSSNMDTPGLMKEPVEDTAKLKQDSTHMVDCSSDAEAVEEIKKHNENCGEGYACLKRNMVVYKRPS